MRRLKDALTVLALVALCGVSLSAGYRVLRCELPERDPYDLRELWSVLKNEDVRSLDGETQRRLVARLEGELQKGTSVRGKLHEVRHDTARYDRLEQNLETLARVWFMDQAEEYARRKALAGDNAARVEVVLDQQLARVGRWLTIANSGGAGGDFRSLMSTVSLMGRVEAWLAEETPERQEMARDFLEALASRFRFR